MTDRPSARVAALAAVVAGSLLLAATAVVVVLRGPERQERPEPAERAARTGTVAETITATQAHLREFPEDAAGWATLGSAYVQQARISGDPTLYPRAEGALRRSLEQRPEGNADAMTGMGALANARHEFAEALEWARRAQRADPYDATALGVQDDALTQLGDYPGARRAAQRMLDLAPGVASFARASYHFEQTGDVAAARTALDRALAEAVQPSDIAFCRLYLGELAFGQGDPREALEQYRRGLEAEPDGPALLAGRARARAATGDTVGAERDYADVVARLPLAQYLLEYAELLASTGRTAQARQQLALIDAETRLQQANGVVDDLAVAVVAADHGRPDVAVKHARAEWSRRHSVLVADALAWALHRAGRNREAKEFAVRAGKLGWRNATFSYHRGMIELALGDRDAAREHLELALSINPYFSLPGAAGARAALDTLRGAR
ncbi:tetratricopeptide repeat protein [Kineosporia sp. J2-2]|uniref:Tetratricopeptide repeat protein n=1 Tax=Kineosporia corallincola TaxID=2835133 RepID=A0ABS5THV3_9ACTN|nr:tetratricopeptide repeat protein [Kineosporia corallincola]MBT0770674.1 tetratricopeptide repeat protein [Kineosporia corallincola]